MLMGDRKKAVAIIIGGLQPSYVGKENGAMEGEYKTPGSEADAAQNECASELIACIKSDDAEGFVKAFKDLLTLCDGSDETYDEAM